jgi:hypothetical protein
MVKGIYRWRPRLQAPHFRCEKFVILLDAGDTGIDELISIL